jgi:cathepsin B
MNYLALTLLSVLALTGAYLAFCPEAPQPSLQAHKELSFHEHLQKKVEHINSQDLTWKARSHERWEKISKEAFVRSLGVKKPHGRSHSLPKKSDKLPSLPENFDSRVRWPNCRSLKTVRDQSSCGSCWAFGAAEALSDRICIASGQQSQVQISTADLLSCCSECGYGCDGGWPPLAW